MNFEHMKVYVSGGVYEVYRMQFEPKNGFDNPNPDDGFDALGIPLNGNDLKRDREKILEGIKEKQDRKLQRRAQTMRDTRNKIRRLLLENFDNNSKFVTLTFREHVTCPKAADEYFKKFIQRLRRRYDFKYIAVKEFQQSGRVHYHMIADLPYIQNGLLRAIWQNRPIRWKNDIACIGTVKVDENKYLNALERFEKVTRQQFQYVDDEPELGGWIRINNITQVDNIGAYVTKYMSKDIEDERLLGMKMYLRSEGLEEPKMYTGKAAEIILREVIGQKKEVYASNYSSEYQGIITYKEYNLKRS